MTETQPPRLFGKPKKIRTIYPLPNWIYHVKAQNPMIGDRGVMTYKALVWKQLWSTTWKVTVNVV